MTCNQRSIKAHTAVSSRMQSSLKTYDIVRKPKKQLVILIVMFLSVGVLFASSSSGGLDMIADESVVDSVHVVSSYDDRVDSIDEAMRTTEKIRELRLSIDSLYVNFSDYYLERAEELGFDVSPKSQFERSIDYYLRASKSLALFSEVYWSQIKPLKDELNNLLQKPMIIAVHPMSVSFINYDADASRCNFCIMDPLQGYEVECNIENINGRLAQVLVENLEDFTFFVEYRCNIFDVLSPASFGVFIDQELRLEGKVMTDMITFPDINSQMQIFKFTGSGNAFFATWSNDVNYNKHAQQIRPFSMKMVDLCNLQSSGYTGLDRDYYHYTALRGNGVNISNDLRFLGTGGRIERLEFNTRVSRLQRPVSSEGSYTRGEHTILLDDAYGKHHFVIFSPDSRFVLIGSSTAQIYNPFNGQKLHDFEVEAFAASWSADGSRITLQTRYDVYVYNALDLSLITTYQADNSKSRISADGKWLIATNSVRETTMRSSYIFVSLEQEDLRYSRILPIAYASSVGNVEIVNSKYLIMTFDGALHACDITEGNSEPQRIMRFNSDFNVVPSGNSIIDSQGSEYFLKLDLMY